MYEKRKNDILDRINQGNIYFSIISMISCTLIFLLLFFNKKKLENLTFNLLKLIFISEIVNNIGNLFQINYGNKVYNLIALSLISFSDIFTNILFLFFSYCSIKIIKESKRENKDKISKYILISFLFSLLYALIVLLVNINENIITDIRFKRYYYKYDKDNGKIFGIRFYICSFIHTLAIILISFFNFNNTYKVLVFLRDKKKKDKVNSRKIFKYMKLLYRFTLICILYWVFLIPRILLVGEFYEDCTLRDIIYLLSDSFFCLRGFLLSINTIKIYKVEMILRNFFEVKIKYYLFPKK